MCIRHIERGDGLRTADGNKTDERQYCAGHDLESRFGHKNLLGWPTFSLFNSEGEPMLTRFVASHLQTRFVVNCYSLTCPEMPSEPSDFQPDLPRPLSYTHTTPTLQ